MLLLFTRIRSREQEYDGAAWSGADAAVYLAGRIAAQRKFEMIDIDLPGLRVVSWRLDGNAHVFDVECFGDPESCPRCGAVGRLYRHGSHTTTCRDRPLRGYPVQLLVKIRRYKCRVCGETFREIPPGIRDDRHMTERCAQFIQNRCLCKTFVQIANVVGCDEKTVRLLAAEHIASVNNGYLPPLPAWLGIHETHIDGAMRLVLTDIGGQKPIEILVNCDSESLAAWLLRYQDRSMVKCVAIHMWQSYREVCDQLLPGTPVIVDRYQIERMADFCMGLVRRRVDERRRVAGHLKWDASGRASGNRTGGSEKERFKLEMGLDSEREVVDAERFRHALHNIYDLPKDKAAAALDALVAGMGASLERDFVRLLSNVRNWRAEILAYFDFPLTDGYAEILTRIAKAFNRPRPGRRYNFDVLRARILFGEPRERALPMLPPPSTPSCGKRGITGAYYRHYAHPTAISDRGGNIVTVCPSCNLCG